MAEKQEKKQKRKPKYGMLSCAANVEQVADGWEIKIEVRNNAGCSSSTAVSRRSKKKKAKSRANRSGAEALEQHESVCA